jgi:hypothetical protein
VSQPLARSSDAAGGQGRPGVGSTLAARFNRGTTVPMASQSVVPKKKKRGPPPTGKGVQVQVRLLGDLLAPLDQWIAAQPTHMTRPEAIRYALRDWLISQGLIKISNDREDLT